MRATGVHRLQMLDPFHTEHKYPILLIDHLWYNFIT